MPTSTVNVAVVYKGQVQSNTVVKQNCFFKQLKLSKKIKKKKKSIHIYLILSFGLGMIVQIETV